MGNKKPTLGNGKICYLEIPAKDIEESSSFYKKIFGWKINFRGDGEMGFHDAVGEVSGTWIKDRNPMTEAGLVISLMVDSVADTIELIKENGGTIVRPIDSEKKEITAWFTDPAGNLFGLYQHNSG